MDLARIGDGFPGRAQVRLGDDFEQRCTGAIQVDGGLLGKLVVNRFAGILLEMRAGDADFLVLALGRADKDMALADDRQLVLRNLIALR